MLNSESKISSHFGPLETKSVTDKPVLFSIILFAREGCDNTSAWESLERQTIDNWELIIVSPPSGNMAFFDLISEKSIQRKILTAEFSSLSKVLESRNSNYISFINQDTFWIPDKLSHEYALFDSSAATMIFSTPLLTSERTDDGARIPRLPLKPNQLFTGGKIFDALIETEGDQYFFIDNISVRREALLEEFDSRILSFWPAIIAIAQKKNVFFSDKCVMEIVCEKLLTDTTDIHVNDVTDVGRKGICRAAPRTQAFEPKPQEIEVACDAVAAAQQQARDAVAAAEVSRDIVLNSTTWRATAPLRRLCGRYPRITSNLRRVLQAIWRTPRNALSPNIHADQKATDVGA